MCSGISARTGWDVRLVRGLVIVATLLLWVPVILYGLAWLLLPDGPDGPIEGQLALGGDFDWAQLWASLIIVAGIVALPSSIVVGPSIIFLWWVAVAGSVVALIVYFSSNRNATPTSGGTERVVPMSTPNQNQGPSGHKAPGLGGEPGRSQAGQSAAYQQGAFQQARPQQPAYGQGVYQQASGAGFQKQQPPKISNLVGFLTVGILFLIAAGGVLAMFGGGEGAPRIVLGTIGLIVLVTGGVLTWAALTGRRGGWFLGFSIVGAVLLMPVTLFGMAVAGALSNSYGMAVTWPTADYGTEYESQGPGDPGSSEVTRGSAWLGSETTDVWATDADVVWDLTQVGSEVSDGLDEYTLEASFSKVAILVTKDSLPTIRTWNVDGAGSVGAQVQDPSIDSARVDAWIESDFLEDYGPGFGTEAVSLGLDTLDSEVVFVFLSSEQADVLRENTWGLVGESNWPSLGIVEETVQPVEPAAPNGPAEQSQSGSQPVQPSTEPAQSGN